MVGYDIIHRRGAFSVARSDR